jgi:3'-phosphoadenosine 5'-phosphosulfate sulfotransferase (PAPS reductase)/FAD synthetase
LYPNTPAVFVDTGLEYPELREFVKSVDNVVWLKPEMNFRKVIEHHGYPIISKEVSKRIVEYYNARQKGTLKQSLAYQEFNGIRKAPNGDSFFNKKQWRFLLDAPFKMSHKCCDIMKKKPAKKYEKESGKFPIIGTMAVESQARKTAWKIHGCNAFDTVRPASQPLSFWTEQDILEYIQKYKLPYASVYGEIIEDINGCLKTTKCDRTGCVFCGFGCHLEKEPNRFQRLKETHPKLHSYCMKPWEEGGLGMKEVLDYINVKTD